MEPTTPLKAIREKCLDCSAGIAAEVKNCEFENCPLWPYRNGRNPARKGVGNRKPRQEGLISKKRS